MLFLPKRKKSRDQYVTPGVITDLNPSSWEKHRFGLSESRWKNLAKKTILITGAGTGYGKSISIALALAGCEVFLTGRREEKLRETAEEIKTFGTINYKCHILPADLTDTSQVKNVVNKIKGETDSLYGLVHCAALATKNNANPLQSETFETWENLFRTNVTAPWFLTREMFPHMVKEKSARIILFSSGAGWAFTSGFGPYNVSKAALNNLTVSMAEEFTASYPNNDIQINAIQPGEARTEMNQGSKINPFAVVNMTLLLLSHSENGPNGKFFHRDGRHLEFTDSKPFWYPLN